MKKHCFCLFIAGSVMYLLSCNSAYAQKTAMNRNDSTATFDMSKARQWIENDNAKFMEEIRKGDSNAVAAHYSSDAWLMLSGREPVKGKDITSAWGGAMRMGMKDLKVTTVDLTGNADMLAETGMYEMYGDNNKLIDKGKYLVVWKPENGGWKIYRDIGNTNMPPQH
jgi:ketosteroid isomerase-like protein